MNKIFFYLSGLVIILALFLRLYRLSDRPLGFTWDEAALGYNAYSLFKTGRDEYGIVAPVIFKSFGDFKPGLYVYSAVPAVSMLGLSEFSTRLPSAVFGTLLVISVGLLTAKLFGMNAFLPGLFVMAVNPWAIHFSRGAWEANLALLLSVLGSLLFIKRRYLLSALFFGLTLWTYQGAKMFTPLILLALIFTFRPRTTIRRLLMPILLLGLLSLPILLGWSSQTGRLKVFSVFSYTRNPEVINLLKLPDAARPVLFPLFHAEIIDQGRGIVQRYLNHFSPRFLFIGGDWSNIRQSTAYHGNFYPPEILGLLIGLYVLTKIRQPGSTFIILWLLIAPLPSAFSRDIISGVRSLPLVVPISVIVALGLQQLFNRKLFALGYLSVLFFSVFYFFDLAVVHDPHYSAADWLYPYKPAFEIIQKTYPAVDQVVFTTQLGQPYIFALFYFRYDPASYQQQSRLAENIVGDVGEVNQFAKFVFRPIYWPHDRSLSSALVVGGPYEIPEQDLLGISNLGAVHLINYPNGSIGLKIAELR